VLPLVLVQDRRERVTHGRYVASRMADIAIPKTLFADSLG
jgi:hypothetical protein